MTTPQYINPIWEKPETLRALNDETGEVRTVEPDMGFWPDKVGNYWLRKRLPNGQYGFRVDGSSVSPDRPWRIVSINPDDELLHALKIVAAANIKDAQAELDRREPSRKKWAAQEAAAQWSERNGFHEDAARYRAGELDLHLTRSLEAIELYKKGPDNG